MLALKHAHDRRIRRAEPPMPSPEFPRGDIGLPDWVYTHARDLYYRDVDPADPYFIPDAASDDDRGRCEERIGAFRPFERALQAVANATGYAETNVEKIIQMHRREATVAGRANRRTSRRSQ
jgi:hypothetical protein